jgi:hypothetical protein
MAIAAALVFAGVGVVRWNRFMFSRSMFNRSVALNPEP